MLGCKVENTDVIPNGMVAKTIEDGNYEKFIAKGDLTKGAVYEAWAKIWNADLDRLYTADFEIYGEKAQNPTDAEVEILVAIK
ncbi:GyrI-like domain-containing protein [Phocoenobacter atlanticus]|uniref:GyrI-like domain-containing protein n=1 Tax=Phocoenobacter atlanticus TaxID=3416742 RepID=UPI00274F3C3B|nr:effector binding domain-containing protein [Pasteurella atlantica]MDP8100894.1 effector binding domain-containing protein [Pasteurella atlantica]